MEKNNVEEEKSPDLGYFFPLLAQEMRILMEMAMVVEKQGSFCPQHQDQRCM